MEEINPNNPGEAQAHLFNELKMDPATELKHKKTAEAFMQLGEEIGQELEQEPAVQQPRQKNIDMNQRQSTPKEQARSLAMGPKYLEALDHVIGMADIRAIEAQLPILKTKVEITPLTGQEEQALKTAAVTPESFLKKMDELLFNHTTFANFRFGSFEEFLTNLFPPDKAVLIWGLLTSSYLVLPTLEKECQACGEKYFVDKTPNDLIHNDSITKIWDSELPPSEERRVQSTLEGYLTFELGMPSEKDKLIISNLLNPEQAKENIEQTGGLMSYTDNMIFFTKTIVVGEGDDRIVLTDTIQDIYPFLKNLPPKIADATRNQIDLSVFDNYMPRFYLNTVCTKCKAQEEVDVDPEIAFFRKAISL